LLGVSPAVSRKGERESVALTGLDIFKLLPKKNCNECGVPTCLAFAMALASGKASLESCPYVSDEAKEALGAAAAPPIRLVKLGGPGDDHETEIGDEQVLFRHDKTFYHPPAVIVEVSDKLSDGDIEARMAKINGLVFERVGREGPELAFPFLDKQTRVYMIPLKEGLLSPFEPTNELTARQKADSAADSSVIVEVEPEIGRAHV